jgi:Second Messenger Oligonucleotide or Dinucleotide Synthetase domain
MVLVGLLPALKGDDMNSAAMRATTDNTVDELLTLICHHLQITDLQQAQAETRYQTLGRTLDAPRSPLFGHGPGLYPQGSLKLGTTVKPLGREEFDLDLVCELETDARRFPYPPQLIIGIAGYLNSLPAYVGKVRTKNRCVRIVYADQFHMDILPACQDPSNGGTHLLVPDRDSHSWKPSNPKGYAKWFESRCSYTPRLVEGKSEPIPPKEPVVLKPTLKLATQLLKRWRDLKYAERKGAAPISIVLTTLAGLHFNGQDSVSTALVEILDKIVGELPAQNYRLVVWNPVNSAEDLSEKWNENPDAYYAFARDIRGFREQMHEIVARQSLDSLCKKLSKAFGEDISKSVMTRFGRELEQSRDAGNLYVQRHSGTLSRIATAGAVTALRPHTFYGR